MQGLSDVYRSRSGRSRRGGGCACESEWRVGLVVKHPLAQFDCVPYHSRLTACACARVQLPLKVSLHILHTTSHISGVERAADTAEYLLYGAPTPLALYNYTSLNFLLYLSSGWNSAMILFCAKNRPCIRSLRRCASWQGKVRVGVRVGVRVKIRVRVRVRVRLGSGSGSGLGPGSGLGLGFGAHPAR